MREAVKRARWKALTLVLLCVGALSYPAPSAPSGHDAGPSLDLPAGALVSAVPAPAGAVVLGAPDESTPRSRRAPAPLTGAVARGGHALVGPTPPDRTVSRDDDFLLGLAAAPANAPPSL